MSRVPMGSDGGAWAMDPETAYGTGFVPQGIGADLIATLDGLSAATDVDAFAARVADPGREGVGERLTSPGRSCRCATATGWPSWTATSTSAPAPRWRRLAGLPAVVRRHRRAGRVRRGRAAEYHWVERIDHVHHAGNSSGIVDGASLVLIGKRGRRAPRPA